MCSNQKIFSFYFKLQEGCFESLFRKKKINTMNARGRESEKKLRKGATHRYHWLYVIKYPENLIKKRDFL